jgi:hypothetical protein
LNQKNVKEADALLGNENFHLTQPSLEATQVFQELATWNALQGNWRKASLRLLALIQVNRFDDNDLTENATRALLPVAPTLIEAGDPQTYGRVRNFPSRTAARDSAACLVQAMAAWQMNRKDEARSLFQKERPIVEPKIAPPLTALDADYGGWFDWLDAHILLREAKALIGKAPGR